MLAPDPIFARTQMGISLGFHIVFAAVGIAMPLMMAIAETFYLKTKDRDWLILAKKWAKGTAVFFAVGAVSGTVLSFELGLLFPKFMQIAGPVVGNAFALEGFAFFTEAIFLGLYLYGWDKLKPVVHVICGYLVALSGVLSAVFVTTVNAWMNTPAGAEYDIRSQSFHSIKPWEVMTSPSAAAEVTHGTLAAYLAVAVAVAGIHAWALVKNKTATYHRKALLISLWLFIPCAIVQPFLGHYSGQVVAKTQPLKLAAMEWHLETQSHAPVKVLGLIEIPGLLSLLATGKTDSVVVGLNDFPKSDWPPRKVNIFFQIMVGIGSLLFAVALWFLYLLVRKKEIATPLALTTLIALSPTGLIALEAGWLVTELGRQPWVIFQLLRTSEAVTPMPGLIVPLILFTLVYLALAYVVLRILKTYVTDSLEGVQ